MADRTLVNLVQIYANSTGSGVLTLGSAVAGYRGVEALADGGLYGYSIQQGSNYEVGQGTYLAATQQLIRQVIVSSAGNGPIDLGPNAQVAFTVLAEDLKVMAGAPLSGNGPPPEGLGLVGQGYYDVADPANPIFYGPKQVSGWGTGLPIIGPAGSVTANSGVFNLGSSPTTGYTFSFVAPSTDVRPNTSATRGEIRLIPNDVGGKDASAGGELTVAGYDTQTTEGQAGQQVGVFYIQRTAGVNVGILIRSLATGDKALLPIRVSADGGSINWEWLTDGTPISRWPMIIQPTFHPGGAPATLRLRDELASVDFEDTSVPTAHIWRQRNNGGKLEWVDITAAAIGVYLDTNRTFVSVAGFVGNLTGNVTGSLSGNVTTTSLTVSKAGKPTILFENTNGGGELSAVMNIKDTGGATTNNWKIGGGYTADGQFGLYDVTGSKLVYEYRRTTLGAAGGSHRFYDPINPPVYTVSGLPPASAALLGARATVTDANATTFASIVAGGGSNVVPVYCDGAAWKIG